MTQFHYQFLYMVRKEKHLISVGPFALFEFL